jgi:hypothetical protein
VAIDARGHTVPLDFDVPRRRWFNDLSESINDFLRFATVAEANAWAKNNPSLIKNGEHAWISADNSVYSYLNGNWRIRTRPRSGSWAKSGILGHTGVSSDVNNPTGVTVVNLGVAPFARSFTATVTIHVTWSTAGAAGVRYYLCLGSSASLPAASQIVARFKTFSTATWTVRASVYRTRRDAQVGQMETETLTLSGRIAAGSNANNVVVGGVCRSSGSGGFTVADGLGYQTVGTWTEVDDAQDFATYGGAVF